MPSYGQGVEEHTGCPRHVPDGMIEGILIRSGGSIESTDLANELERRVMQLLISWGVFGVSQLLDVTAHRRWPFLFASYFKTSVHWISAVCQCQAHNESELNPRVSKIN